MICNGCEKVVDNSMRHAIAANSCPFCGDAILSRDDEIFRNSVSRVLIRNGLESQRAIDNISNQILSVFQAATAPTTSSRPDTPREAVVDESEEDADEVSEDDIVVSDDGEEGPTTEDIRIAREDKVVFTEAPSDKAERLREAARTRRQVTHKPIRRQE